jgi:hypothetical protein
LDASFGDDTTEEAFESKILGLRSLDESQKGEILGELINSERNQVEDFTSALAESLSRNVIGVSVTILHGSPRVIASVSEAILYIRGYAPSGSSLFPVAKFEVELRYSNGDLIRGTFQDPEQAVAFLETFL